VHITKTFQLRRIHTARATENTHAALVLTLAMPLDRIDPYDRGVLLGYQDEEVRVTLQAEDLVDAAEPRPMEKLWSSNGEERMRPGPTETCSECGKVIGDDPDADFYAPLAGPSRPVCGDCAVKLDDQQLAAEASDDEVTQFEGPNGDVVTVDAEGEVVGDTPIGDGAMPERPADAEPVTTPIRRRR
jgi:hypothetical protein